PVDVTFAGLDWDDGNLTKCQRHGVSLDEIASVFAGSPRYLPDVQHSSQELRYIAVGRTEQDRPVFIVFTLRERPEGNFVRPISARYMHAKEVAAYGNT